MIKINEMEENSKQMFEKVKQQMDNIKESSNEILQYEIDQKEDIVKQMNEEMNEFNQNSTVFLEIESDMRDVERDFSEDQAFIDFKEKYEGLYHTLGSSLNNEREMRQNCVKINLEIKLNRIKIQSTLDHIKDFQNKAENTCRDIEKVWETTKNYEHEEKDFIEKTENIQVQIKHLDHEIEEVKRNAKLQNDIKLQKKKKTLEDKTGEIAELQEQLAELRSFNDDTTLEINAHLRERNELEQNIEASNKKKNSIESRTMSFKNEKTNVDQQIVKILGEIKILEKKNETLKEALTEEKHNINKKVKQITIINTFKEEFKKKIQTKENKIKSLKQELNKLETKIVDEKDKKRDLVRKIQTKQQDFDRKERDIVKHSKELRNIQHLKTKLQDETKFLLMQKNDLEEMDAVNQDDLGLSKKQLDIEKDNYNNEGKTRTDMESKIKKMKNSIHDKKEQYSTIESKGKKLKNQVKGYQIASIKLNKHIKNLQKQQEKYGIEASTAHAHYYQTLEELKIKNNIINELQKKSQELETKLKHQKNLYETVRSDRNLYSKNLLEAQEEIGELTKKLMRMTHQISQLREEIKTKNTQILREHKTYGIVDRENKETASKIKIINGKIKSTEEFIKHHETQIAKLKFIIAEATTEKQKQNKDFKMVLNERDILGAQLIKRNQELKSLYEKIKISQSNLAKGQICSLEREKAFDEYREALVRLRKELERVEQDVSHIPEFKKEINSLQRELLKEQCKVRALSDELTHPMNVHRWQKMEATDPENYARIIKIQTLQRQLITKTEEVEKKETCIKKMEKLFMELKNILARQPGPEVYEQIEIYKSSLKEKTNQFKKMLKELKEAQEQVNSNKYQIDQCNVEINKNIEQYFKSREREEREKLQAIQQVSRPPMGQGWPIPGIGAGGLIVNQYR